MSPLAQQHVPSFRLAREQRQGCPGLIAHDSAFPDVAVLAAGNGMPIVPQTNEQITTQRVSRENLAGVFGSHECFGKKCMTRASADITEGWMTRQSPETHLIDINAISM